MSEATVVLETTSGTIAIRLMPDVAPKAVENFSTHVENGYYKKTTFHRVIKDFMIQGGDPGGTGRGGESIWGTSFEDECDPNVPFTRKGLLAMANAGPGTNGSQFFITLAPTPWLHMKHTIFGEVVEGLDVVEKIGSLKTDAADRPRETQEIRNCYVRRDDG